jgi:lysophospholipase L1-like esterase
MFAVRGSSARAWRQSHLAAAFAFNPHELVLVSLGANDCVSDELEAEFFGNVRVLVERIKRAKRVPVLLIPPAACADVRSAMQMQGADVLEPPRGMRLPDGVHATPEGYQAWAEKIAATFGA